MPNTVRNNALYNLLFYLNGPTNHILGTIIVHVYFKTQSFSEQSPSLIKKISIIKLWRKMKKKKTKETKYRHIKSHYWIYIGFYLDKNKMQGMSHKNNQCYKLQIYSWKIERQRRRRWEKLVAVVAGQDYSEPHECRNSVIGWLAWWWSTRDSGWAPQIWQLMRGPTKGSVHLPCIIAFQNRNTVKSHL